MTTAPTLEARLRRLEDRFEIDELIARYCLVMDNRDVEAIGALFTPDVHVWSADGVMNSRGRDAAIEMFHVAHLSANSSFRCGQAPAKPS